MQVQLDRIDRRLLAALQADASRSTADLAEHAGISQSACWRRLQRLEQEKVIRARVALLDRRKIGLDTQVFAQVKLSAHGRSNLAEFAQAIRGFPEVLECFVLMGQTDFMLRIVSENIDAYERFFLEKLSKLPHIQEVVSTVALSEIKSTTALPVNELG